ncbi:MAG: ribonucleotide reductase, partial [Candidatus Gracilibacteria bacterium]
ECLSIEESWLALFNLEFDKEYTIDLSLLRPKGSTNNYGLVASGAVSFAYILLDLIKVIESERKTIPVMSAYSRLNEVLRRGGLYKNGAIVLHTDIDSPNVHEFLASEREDCPWVRLCLNLNQSANDKDILLKALPSVRSGDLFLVKKVYQDGQRLYHNVCLEVLLPHRGTCLLSHVNLGMTSYRTVVSAFEDAMRFLVNLHPNTKVDKDGYYLPPTVDKQVGLGVIGLANFLAYHKVKYKDFVQALKKELDGESDNTLSHTLAKSIIDGYLVAARIAMSHNLERAFAVAPTANTSFYYRDFRGYTTTPEISPPVSRSVIRVSETTEEKVVEYPPDVEIAAEVGWDVYFDLVDQWQRLMNITGLAHSISANWWSDVVVMNEEFINKWLDSNWLSLYYALPVSPEIQDKSELICDDLTCVSCAE